MWVTVGMKTRKRPGRAMCEVMRAPFLAMGSLAIWTRISWPGFSRSLMMGRSEVCMERRDGPRPLAPGRAGCCWALRVRGVRGRARSRRCWAAVPAAGWPSAVGSSSSSSSKLFLFAVLLVEVQLDAVIEVGLLQHLAQVAGANLVGQRLLFKVVQVVVVGLVAVMMAGSVELLFFDGLFFDEAAAGSVG